MTNTVDLIIFCFLLHTFYFSSSICLLCHLIIFIFCKIIVLLYNSLFSAVFWVFLLTCKTVMFNETSVCLGHVAFSDSHYSPSVFGDPFSLASKAGLD